MSEQSSPRSNVELVLSAFAQHRDQIAIVHHDRKVTFGELLDQTYRFARALESHGAKPGDILTLLAGNSPECLTLNFAAGLLGCGLAQLYTGTSSESQARIVDDVDTAILLIDPKVNADPTALLSKCSPKTVLSLGPGTATDLLAEAANMSAETVACQAHPNDVQHIRHTGGTTGHPKGLSYTFEQQLRMLSYRDKLAKPIGLFTSGDARKRQLVCTTMAHMAGPLATMTLMTGGLVVLHDHFDAAEVLATIERERITDLWLLPPLLYRMLDHPDINQRDLSSLVNVGYGGCRSNPRRIAEAVERLGPILTQIYGQTEAGGISVLTPDEHQRPELLDSVGTVIPTTQLSIRDDNGEAVAPGQSGELWVHTGMEMSGYWKRPELTAQTIQQGWVRTGDVGYLDDKGYLHLVDRVKDMIVVVGGHVYTSEIEDLLLAEPGVQAAAVYGTPDPNGAENVNAAVVADDGITTNQLQNLVVSRKGSMYSLSQVTFVEQLPLTDAGKPDKRALRAALN